MARPSDRIEVWDDITDAFQFVEDHLVYVDAPLEGFLRASRTGELFAFRCTPIVPDCLWHWILLPAPSLEVTVKDVFDMARKTPPGEWISIVEDRRGEQPRLTAAWLSAPIPDHP